MYLSCRVKSKNANTLFRDSRDHRGACPATRKLGAFWFWVLISKTLHSFDLSIVRFADQNFHITRPPGGPAIKMDVTTIPIPEDLRSIIEDMRDLIAKSETDHSKVDPTGWQHGGPDFITLVGNLEKEMNKQGFHVSEISISNMQIVNWNLGVGLRQHSTAFFQRRKYPEPLLSLETIVDNPH